MNKSRLRVIFLAILLLTAFGLLIFVGWAIQKPHTLVSSSIGPKEESGVQEISFKRFPVLEYHLIGRPEARWRRTPENLRGDLEWLYHNNYYPMNLKDILSGFPSLPDGKTPVVLTFDDSSSSQFRYLLDGSLDPECAVGVIRAFHEEHPGEWPMRATFFVLIQTNGPDRNLFGQPEYAEKKLKQLVSWGMEVAGHTYSHERLSDISPKAARYALARSYLKLKELTGEEIVSMATPMGLYPSDESVFSGKYQKIDYDYKLVCEVAGGLQVVSTSPKFNPHHINRIQAIDSEWKKFFSR
ncbi:MAG: polysaccharide deacetylase family protein [Candidatus Saganbacteria bacterium]|nr:polysaccharide deacetylase family protein [Candidatus Saganbacteria bacterium]